MIKKVVQLCFCIGLVNSSFAQVYTSEVKVEQVSGDFTGIGTESPTSKLHINTGAPSDRDDIKIGKFSDVDPLGRSGDFPSIYADYVLRIPQRVQIFGGGTGQQYLDIRDQAGSQKIKLDAEGNSFVNGGYFGIGHSNPTTSLHIMTNTAETINEFKIGKFNEIDPLGRTGSYASIWAESVLRIPQRVEIWGSGAGLQYLDVRDQNGNQNVKLNGEGTSFFKHSLGIGVTSTSYELEVNGTVRANTFSAVTPPWSDFVFEENYELRELTEVEAFIERNKHLPDIPSERELIESGLDLPTMDSKLLQKIEELTLYLIEQNKQIESLKQRLIELEKQ